MPKKAQNHATTHQANLPLVNRIAGQVSGIAKMIEDGRYCADILNQIRASRAALKTLEGQILERHLESCVAEAVSSGDAKKKSKKIAEIVSMIKRYE